MDRRGTIVIPPQFLEEECGRFAEGVAAVPLVREPTRRFGYIDTAGRTVIPPRFRGADAFAGGLAPVQVGNRWGFIDHAGAERIPPRFGNAVPFAHGLALIHEPDGAAGYVDAGGTLVWPRRRPPAAETRVPFRSVAYWRDRRDGWHRARAVAVARSAAEYDEIWRQLRLERARPPERLDFAKFDYVLVAQERVYRGDVRVTAIVRSRTRVLVRYDEARPDVHPRMRSGDLVRRAGDVPRAYHVVEVPRQRLPYVFERRDLNASVARAD
ncbi:MAG TPA: WG repeat-containing protein [Polyangia bacterium]